MFFAACFVSAAVLAQVGGGAPSPAPAQAAKAAVKPGVKPSPFHEADDTAAYGKATAVKPAPAPATREVFVKAVAKKAMNRGAQPNRAPLVQQFTNQARPLLRAELIFARNICHLNREELRKVNHDAQKMLDEVVTKIVDAQFQPRVRGVGQGQGRAVNNFDAQQLLQDGVVAVMKRDLTAEQWSLYEAERHKRDENRKRTTIRYFVDAIDRELYLSPEQRDGLEASFKSNWESTWALYLENHLYGNRYYPMTIDTLVTPVLTEAQKKVWQGVQKVGVYWGFAGMLGGFANDADGLEVELGEPARKDQDPNRMIGVMKMPMPMQMQAGGGAAIIREVAPPVEIRGMMKAMTRKAAPKPAARGPEKKVEKTKD